VSKPRSRRCECRCGGAEHGWQEALDIAAASSSGDLLRREQEADQAWSQATLVRAGQDKPKAQTAAGQQAAIKTFIAEVIRWLQRDPDLHKAIKQLGEPFRISRDIDPDAPHRSPTSEEDKRFVEAHVIPGLRKQFGDQRIKKFQKKAGNLHFWCELLAQTAHALDEFRGRYNRAKKAVVAVLTSNGEERPDGWASLLSSYQDVIERAVKLVFKHLPRVATGGISVEGALRLIWPARVLAVLMCREPRRHPAVREYCVKPIAKYGTARIKEEVKDHLRQAFPLEWPGSLSA
jgi:hypothetical protein